MKDTHETSEAGSEESAGSTGPTYEIDTFQLNLECDGLFLLVDTALHNGFHHGDAELQEHITGCETCFDVNSEVL